ncbi:MAG: hypothetical protein ACD_62C00479G0001 [uncultured bacterium]|nr:MAG: hypothetical protein ACD_62C00479G0001 [uncultured bacterium]
MNSDQADFDADGDGDECDIDDDNDGTKDKSDVCPNDANGHDDPDDDGLCGTSDNCEDVANEDQADADADGIGDVCDDDADNDEIKDDADNCPEISNADQADLDADTVGDVCDDDKDDDTILNDVDNCEIVSNEDQTDSDGDGEGDVCDGDTDGDLIANEDDNCPTVANADQTDEDGDLVGDVCDNCFDVENTDQADLDADTLGDVCDSDADGDGETNDTDCDDLDASSHNGALEVFDFADNDCEGTVDQGISLDNAVFSITGEASGNYFGYRAVVLSDVNGDGIDDVLASAYKNSEGGTSAGKVYLIYGAGNLSGDLSAENANVTFVGEAANDYLGLAIASAGDVNGDGLGDFMIAAKGNDAGGSNAGKVYLIYGRDFSTDDATVDGVFDLTQANFIIKGQAANNYFGHALASAGDVNADGYGDIMISSKDYNSAQGRIYLFQGGSLSGTVSASSATATFTGEGIGETAGYALSTAGDFNADGYDDLVISAYYNGDMTYTGKIYVLYGSATLSGNTSLSDATLTYEAEEYRDYAGNSVSGGQDINGDGIDDIIVGAAAYGATDDGRVYVLYGSSTTLTGTEFLHDANVIFYGENSGDNAGISVQLLKDMNGDDLGEILIGAHRNDQTATNAGKVYLIMGSASLTSVTLNDTTTSATLLGVAAGDYAGYGLSDAGDVNGDDILDFFIGAYGTTNGTVYGILSY